MGGSLLAGPGKKKRLKLPREFDSNRTIESMGIARESEMIDLVASQFKALGHPQRIKLLQIIRSEQFCCFVPCEDRGGDPEPIGSCVGDLVRECDLAASTVSHHLKELRMAGLIETERRGQFLYCRAREDVLARLAEFLRSAPRGPDRVSAVTFAEK